jgi:hypothetical protein
MRSQMALDWFGGEQESSAIIKRELQISERELERCTNPSSRIAFFTRIHLKRKKNSDM